MSMGAKPFLLNRVWVATAGAKGVGGGLGRGGGGHRVTNSTILALLRGISLVKP